MKEVWYEIDTLPSNGQWYNENTKIFIRPYTVRETLHLAKMKRDNDILRYNLQGLKAENLELEDMILSDYYFLVLMRNGISGTLEGLMIKDHVCTNCKKSSDHKVSVEDLEVEDLPPTEDFTVTVDSYQLTITPLKVKHILDPQDVSGYEEELPFFKELILAVEAITQDGEALTWNSVSEKVDIFLNLPAQILSVIYESILPKIFPTFKVELICPHCQKSDIINIPLTAEEVKPFCRSEKSTGIDLSTIKRRSRKSS